MIGGGEALGQVTASWFYSRYDFGAECDAFNFVTITSFFLVVIMEYCCKAPKPRPRKPKLKK